MKATTIFTFMIVIFSCTTPARKDIKEENNVQFSLRNSSKSRLKEIEIYLPDTILRFDNLGSGKQTNPIKIKSTYRYSKMKFKDGLDTTYGIQPHDFYGETLFTKGNMTFILDSINPIKKTGKFTSTQK